MWLILVYARICDCFFAIFYFENMSLIINLKKIMEKEKFYKRVAELSGGDVQEIQQMSLK